MLVVSFWIINTDKLKNNYHTFVSCSFPKYKVFYLTPHLSPWLHLTRADCRWVVFYVSCQIHIWSVWFCKYFNLNKLVIKETLESEFRCYCEQLKKWNKLNMVYELQKFGNLCSTALYELSTPSYSKMSSIKS